MILNGLNGSNAMKALYLLLFFLYAPVIIKQQTNMEGQTGHELTLFIWPYFLLFLKLVCPDHDIMKFCYPVMMTKVTQGLD